MSISPQIVTAGASDSPDDPNHVVGRRQTRTRSDHGDDRGSCFTILPYTNVISEQVGQQNTGCRQVEDRQRRTDSRDVATRDQAMLMTVPEDEQREERTEQRREQRQQKQDDGDHEEVDVIAGQARKGDPQAPLRGSSLAATMRVEIGTARRARGGERVNRLPALRTAVRAWHSERTLAMRDGAYCPTGPYVEFVVRRRTRVTEESWIADPSAGGGCQGLARLWRSPLSPTHATFISLAAIAAWDSSG